MGPIGVSSPAPPVQAASARVMTARTKAPCRIGLDRVVFVVSELSPPRAGENFVVGDDADIFISMSWLSMTTSMLTKGRNENPIFGAFGTEENSRMPRSDLGTQLRPCGRC